MPETLDEMIARHKKEVKSFQGEKLAAIKNAKSRGKKAKTAVKEAEFKYEGLEWDLKEMHRMEIVQLSGVHTGDTDDAPLREEGTGATAERPLEEAYPTQQPHNITSLSPEHPTPHDDEARRQKALQKKLKKKHQQRQMEIDREKRIDEENSSAGPSRRQMELEALQTLYLRPRLKRMETVCIELWQCNAAG